MGAGLGVELLGGTLGQLHIGFPDPLLSPLLLPCRPLSAAPPRLRHLHVRLRLSPGGSHDGTSETKDDNLWTVARKVLDACCGRDQRSDNDPQFFLQNIVDAGLVDESEAFGVLWKFPTLAAFSFTGIPALLGYLGGAASVDRVPAWMPLVYSLASFLVGSLLAADASVGDEELEEWARRRERGGGDLLFLELEEVMRRVTWRVLAAALAATVAGVPYGVFPLSFDPAVQGSWLGWDEFVKNVRDVVLRAD